MNTLSIEELKDLRIEAALMENSGVVAALDELIELKGDQVPIAWLNQHGPFGGVVTMSPTMANSWEIRGDDVTPLFTAPQKKGGEDADD